MSIREPLCQLTGWWKSITHLSKYVTKKTILLGMTAITLARPSNAIQPNCMADSTVGMENIFPILIIRVNKIFVVTITAMEQLAVGNGENVFFFSR